MSYRFTLICLFVLATLGIFALSARAQDDIDAHRSCAVCGMDRKAYGYSRMLILYQDGGQTGVCSLHCAVAELDAHKERAVKSLLVADRDTRILLDAEKAIWVMGGKKRGVMTQNPKWAFATDAAARSFMAANGGTIATWAEVTAATRKESTP